MIDHFVIGVANLEEGCRYIESELGVRPIYGGSHPGIGTHNALLSLDNGTYIEIIAPDPDQPPNLALHRYFTSWETPALAWWAIRCSELEQVKKKLAERGFDGGEVQSGSRQLDNGEILKWELLLPKVPRLEAAMPFFISWDNETIHPAQAAPSAGGLMSFSIQCRWAHLLADYESDISNLVATDPPSLSLEIANKNSHIVFTTPANFPKGVATLLNEH